MKNVQLTTDSAAKTMEVAEHLAGHLHPGDIVCLFGELGSGKTTFAKGIAQGLKVNPHKVNSPTFVLLNSYHGRLPLYHFDFYRLEEKAEISLIGYEEFLYGDGVAVIEWPERLGDLLPKEYLGISLIRKTEETRLIKFNPQGLRYKELTKHLLK